MAQPTALDKLFAAMNRQCNTAEGRPKRKYTAQTVKAALCEHPDLVAYRCARCGSYHVANRV